MSESETGSNQASRDSIESARRKVAEQRGKIDALDRQLVELLQERRVLVSEIAALKRAGSLPIRDDARERAMHALHAQWAEELELPPTVIEGLFRMVLWSSRNYQAQLRTAVPAGVASRRVAIIGGEGSMGRQFARAFESLGNEVLRADLDTSLRPAEAVADAEVVLFAVPIAQTERIIAELAPLARPDALLTDITSVKAGPVAAMREHGEATVIGTHPLFGPAVNSMQGQRIVLTPAWDADADAREGDPHGWLPWLETSLRAMGLELVRSTPAGHDRAMAIVQVLTHYSTEVLGRSLQRLGVSLEETLRFTSPIYYIDMLMAARHFAQRSELYASIQTQNPNTEQVTAVFREVAEELAGIISAKDGDAFSEVFDEVREFFGEFSPRALDESRYLIDRLVERR